MRRIFEQKHHAVLSARSFAWRLCFFLGLAALLVVISLGIGVAGYHWIAGFGWIDSILSASMILTGMGPIGDLGNDVTAKLFVSAYALFSGLVFITVMGVILAPIAHRILHKFHFDDRERQGK